jgi:hypothetical protein|tara:strand:+ start:2905 stop:3273 length:369 start_codon:yes stop_codon:yes gene_type:complete
MITGRQLLEALQKLDETSPERLDEQLFATFGNDDNGNADLIEVADLLAANDLSINGVDQIGVLDNAESPVVVLNEDETTSPKQLLDETLLMFGPFSDSLMPEEYERYVEIVHANDELQAISH